MNRTSLITVALAALVAGPAFAADYPSSGTTAAFDMAPHPLAGEVASDVDPYDTEIARPSTLTRAQVHADVLRARAAGELGGIGDDVGYPYAEQPGPTGRVMAKRPTTASTGKIY